MVGARGFEPPTPSPPDYPDEISVSFTGVHMFPICLEYQCYMHSDDFEGDRTASRFVTLNEPTGTGLTSALEANEGLNRAYSFSYSSVHEVGSTSTVRFSGILG